MIRSMPFKRGLSKARISGPKCVTQALFRCKPYVPTWLPPLKSIGAALSRVKQQSAESRASSPALLRGSSLDPSTYSVAPCHLHTNKHTIQHRVSHVQHTTHYFTHSAYVRDNVQVISELHCPVRLPHQMCSILLTATMTTRVETQLVAERHKIPI